MKTVLPIEIKTQEDIVNFLKELHKNDELFHLEDDPYDIIDINQNPLFTDWEAHRITELMKQVFKICDDPCAIALDIINAHDNIFN